MSDLNKDIVTEKQNQMYENLKHKLKSIQVSGDKDILWNFEAGFLLGILEGYEKELETYKKIAEKLAEEFGYTDNDVCADYHEIGKCKFEREKDNRKTCIQCIIDWARKEVENEPI